jgi:porin
MHFIAKALVIGGLHFPPLLIAGFLVVLAAMLTAMLLKRCRLLRSFYIPPLIIVATGVLGLGLGGSVWAQPLHKGKTVHMDTQAKDKAETLEDKVKAASLIEQAPMVVNINRRYFKFFGDPHETVRGGFFERSQLTNNWNGGRDKLVDAGVYLDVGLTQNLMSNVSGGTDDGGGLPYTASMDIYVNFDTAKLTNAAWPGATIFLHAEARWKDGVQKDAGSAIPPVMDDTMPKATERDAWYLSEYYLVQALSPKVSMWIGQMDGAGLIDGNAFANSEKFQFMNTAFVDNPAVGAFAPYTAFTAAAVYLPAPEHILIAGAMDSQGRVDSSVIDTYHTDATLLVASYGFLPDFGGKPGRYQIVGAWTNKETASYAISNRLELAEELVGIKTRKTYSDNYISIGTFDQYLHVKDKERMIGWGLFARYGWAPKDRNVIDQFYSFGLGGRGCLIPGRDLDFWGLGWAGTHISGDLRKDLSFLNIDVKKYEHVIEGFYNIAVTPAAHLTLDAQYIINPVIAQIRNDTGRSVDSDDHAFVLGARLQLDF